MVDDKLVQMLSFSYFNANLDQRRIIPPLNLHTILIEVGLCIYHKNGCHLVKNGDKIYSHFPDRSS